MHLLLACHDAAAMSPEEFFAKLRNFKIPRIRGTAIFLTRTVHSASPLLVHHIEQFGALQHRVIALMVRFADVPRIAQSERLEVRKLSENFWHVTAHFGFVQVPDLPAALRQAKMNGCDIDVQEAVFFTGRDAVIANRSHNAFVRAQLAIFAFMLRNAVHAVDLFRIPPANFVEIARLVEV
jgi:KUP system potassium uptake protein